MANNNDANQLEFVSSMMEAYKVVRMINNIRSKVGDGAQVIVNAGITSRTHGEILHPFAEDAPECPGYEKPTEMMSQWAFVVQAPADQAPYLAFGVMDEVQGLIHPIRVDANMRREDLKTIFSLISLGLFPRLLSSILALIQGEINFYGRPLLGAVKPPLDEWNAFASALEASQRGATNG